MSQWLTHLRSPRGLAAASLVYTAATLTVLEYWFMPFVVQARIAGRRGPPSMEAGTTWALASSAVYLIVPTLVVLLVQRERLARIGYSWRGFARHVPLYLGLFALTVPAL